MNGRPDLIVEATEKSLVEDSAFPFKPREPLTIRIENDKLIVEREEKNVEDGRKKER